MVAVVALMLVTACGVTRGNESRGLHRLRMMVPNSPGGGYDLTARTAVKIMEDTDITSAVTELQKTLTILQATQASFTKLTGLSLFDYLR